MVAFGPWIEEEDYAATDRYIGSERLLSNGGGTVGLTRGPSENVEDTLLYESELPPKFAEAYDLWDTGFHGLRVNYSWAYTLSYPNWTMSFEVSTQKWPRQVAPPDEPWVYYYGWSPEYPMPDNAIGVQHQGFDWDPADPYRGYVHTVDDITGCYLRAETLLDRENADRLSGGTGGLNDLSSSYNTAIRLLTAADDYEIGSKFSTAEAGNLTASLGADINLTGYLADSGWSGVLYTKSPWVPPKRPPEALPVENTHGNTTWGWRITDLRLRWMLKPPIYRWVLDEEPPPAYRRIHPRDALGTASARRNYPPAKAVQYGNRTSGGYL